MFQAGMWKSSLFFLFVVSSLTSVHVIHIVLRLIVGHRHVLNCIKGLLCVKNKTRLNKFGYYMDNLICVTYNVKGLGSPIKRKKILNQLKKLNCAVAMLQETHLSEKEHVKLRREWIDQQYSSSFQNGRKRGVVILFNKSVYFSHEKTFTDKEGWYVMVVGSLGGLKMTFLNLYAPNEDCPNFFKNIAKLIANKAEGTLLQFFSNAKTQNPIL